MKVNVSLGIPAGIFNNVSAQSDNSKPSVSKPYDRSSREALFIRSKRNRMKEIKQENDKQLRKYEQEYNISYRYITEPRFEDDSCELTYHPIGVVVAVSCLQTSLENQVVTAYIRAGWSLCNTKKDKFDKLTGKYRAVEMALDSEAVIPPLKNIPAYRLGDVKHVMNSLLKEVLFRTITAEPHKTISVVKGFIE